MLGSAFRKFWMGLFGISALVLVMFPPPPLAAQTTSPALVVEPYYDGHYKFGEWLPLRVTVSNDGAPISAQLRVDNAQTGVSNAWLVPLELPTGARKQLTLYVMPPSFAGLVRVRLMNGTQELARASASLTLHSNTDYLVGVIASRGDAFNALNGVVLDGMNTRKVRPITLALQDLPDRVDGLYALDALVISDTDTSALSQEQTSALTGWVRAGGRLMLGGGASAARTLSGLPDAIAGAFRTTNGVTEIQTLTALGDFAEQPVRVAGPFPASFANAGAGLIEQDGKTLLAEQRVGDGYVTYSALDLAASPFDAWSGAARFWKNVLLPNSAYPMNMPTDVSPRLIRTRMTSQALQNLPMLSLPSLNILSILLAVYIILIGPVNYLVLRRLKKLDWGWVTMPALTLLFAVGAFGTSNQMRGNDVIVNQISFVELNAHDALNHVETLVGVYSPSRGGFNLEFPASSLVMPVTNQGDPFGRSDISDNRAVEIEMGEHTRVRGVEINQGGLQAFSVVSHAPDNWRVESDLTVDGNRVEGTVTNHLDKPLTDAVLVNGGHYILLGTLEPNQTLTLEQLWRTLDGPVSMLVVDGPQGNTRRPILDNYFGGWNGLPQLPYRPMVIGWLDAAPVQVQIGNAQSTQQNTTIVLAEADLKPGGKAVQLGANDWQAQIVQDTGGAICGQANFLNVTTGYVTLAFLPRIAFSPNRVTKLTLVVQDGNPQKVEMQDQTGAWIPVNAPSAGRYDLQEPARFVSRQGIVNLRVSGVGGQQCVRYSLELQGELEQ